MSGTATLGLEVRTSGLDNATRQMNAFVSQADKAASAAARLEKTWSGVARMMSGFNAGGAGGAGGMDAMAKAAQDCVKVFGEFEKVTARVGSASNASAMQVTKLSASARQISSAMGTASTAQANMAKSTEAFQKSMTAAFKTSLSDISDSIHRTEQMVGEMCGSLDRLKGASSNASPVIANLAKATTAVGTAMAAFGNPIGPVLIAVGTLVGVTNELVGSIETAEQRLERLTREHAKAAREVDKLERVLGKLNTGLRSLNGDKEKEKQLVKDIIRLMPALKRHYDGTTKSINQMADGVARLREAGRQVERDKYKEKEDAKKVAINTKSESIDKIEQKLKIAENNIEYANNKDIKLLETRQQFALQAADMLRGIADSASSMMSTYRELDETIVEFPQLKSLVKPIQDKIKSIIDKAVALIDKENVVPAGSAQYFDNSKLSSKKDKPPDSNRLKSAGHDVKRIENAPSDEMANSVINSTIATIAKQAQEALSISIPQDAIVKIKDQLNKIAEWEKLLADKNTSLNQDQAGQILTIKQKLQQNLGVLNKQVADDEKRIAAEKTNSLKEKIKEYELDSINSTKTGADARLAIEEMEFKAYVTSLGDRANLTKEQKENLFKLEELHRQKCAQLTKEAEEEEKQASERKKQLREDELRKNEEAAQKEKDIARELAMEEARLAGATRAQKELELDAYVEAIKKKGAEGLQLEKLTQLKRVELNKTSLDHMLDDWADMSKGWEQISKDFLTGVQQNLFKTFQNIFEGVDNAWENLWQGMKNIAYQAIAAIATKLASAMIAKGATNIFSGFGDWFAKTSGSAGDEYAVSQYGVRGEFGDASKPFGATGVPSASGMQMNKLWGGGGFGVGNAMGIVGGAMGMYSAYKSGDPMGGAMAGAALGTSIMPGWGTAIGAAAGLVAGMIGGDGDDTADREADAKMFKELAEKISSGMGNQKDYIEAIKYGHRSDNRVGGEAMEQLYQQAKKMNLLDWWAPTPGQLGDGTKREYTDEQWKRAQLYGGDKEGGTGSLSMWEWFGGEGKGGWNGDENPENWMNVQNVMDGLSEETIDKMGSALGTFRDLAEEWGVSVQDLLKPLIDAKLSSEEMRKAVEELTPATLIQNAADAERAKGLNELEIVNNKVTRSIKLMAGWNKMDEDGKSEMIEMLRKDAGRREELMNASKRLKEIEEKLMGAHKLSEEEVEKLAKEYGDLSDKLGLNKSASAKAATAAEDFAKVMTEQVIPAIEKALGLKPEDENEQHHGGLIYHSGGMVGAMLNAGMITAHGGSPRMHSGGLRPDERMTILQAGEFVVQRSSVNAKTLGALRNINATGRLPMEQISQAMRQMSNTPKFHNGGPVTPLPAMASTSRPQGGDNGRPVTINFSPQISVNAESGADAAKIEAAVTKALEKSRVALKRQLEQTGYQVVDAQ